MKTASLLGVDTVLLSFHYYDDDFPPRVPALREARYSSIPNERNFRMYNRPRVTKAENKEGLSPKHMSIPVLRIPELLTNTERHWP